jgi:glutamate/tyrosine decarboxylase-like PLP-dependent enzyme
MLGDRASFPALLEAASAAAAEFLASLPERPVAVSKLEPPAPLDLPATGHGAAAALAAFRNRYEEGLSGSAGPRYLGFVTGGSTPAALAGDWLAAAYDQNLSNGVDSLATAVENETIHFLRQLFGLPASFAGVFVSGATMANFVGLATGRQWAAARLGVDAAEEGLRGLPPIPLLGATPHASVEKSAAMLGFGRRAIERIEKLPGRQAIDPRALEDRLQQQNGAPAIVLGSAGEVNSGDFDNLEALAELAEKYGAWLHVDGAFGLFAALLPERAHLLRGLEKADSVATDGHKWLNVPYDSGIVFTRHLGHQIATFRAVAAYLGAGPDLLHRTPENSRRFRALPAWMTLQAYGREGYREMVERCCAFASRLGERLERDPRFELLAPVNLNIVCFALREPGAEARDRFLRRLAEGGQTFLTPTLFEGRPGARAAFSNWSIEASDLELIATALAAAAGEP